MEGIQKEMSKAQVGIEGAPRYSGTRLTEMMKENLFSLGNALKSDVPTGSFIQEGLGKYALKKYVERLLHKKQGNAEEMKKADKQADKQERQKLRPALHLNGPEYGVEDFTAVTNRFHNENIGKLDRDYHYELQESLEYLASRGWKYVKVPIRWERIQRTINGDLSPEELIHLRDFMDRSYKAGLRVIIDLHNYGIYYENVDGVGTRRAIGHSRLPIASFADLWLKLAKALKDHPATFAYAIMAEPQSEGGLTTAVWQKASQAAVDAIRSVDIKSEIHVAGFEWSSTADWEEYNGPDAWITDTSGGIIRYEAHHYFDSDYSGEYRENYRQAVSSAQKNYPKGNHKDALHTRILTELKGYTDWLERNNVLGIIGEMGWAANDKNWEALALVYLDELEKLDIPVIPWCAGEWTEGDLLAIYGVTNYTISHPLSQAEVWESMLS
jgi:endoglucanase